MARASKMNRGYGGGLAAGAPAGTAFQSSFQSSMAPMAPPAPRAPMAPMAEAAPMAPMAPMPAPAQPPPVDFSNMFNEPPKTFTPEPLPQLGQQSFSQPPPSPFGPAPLPFGGFRQEGGPVMPGQAYIVGEAGEELFVPQQPGMILPNPTLTGRASAQDGAMRSGPLSTRGATPVGSGRGMTPERRLEIAARRGNQRANLTLFNAQQFGRAGRGAARALPPPMSMPMGRAPQAPAAARPMPNFPPRSPAQQPPPEPMAAPQFDISNMLPPMAPTDAMAPLPPSTLMGGSGVPPPPDFQVNNVGSYEVLTQNTPNGPKFYNARVAPDAAPAPGMTTVGYRMLDDYNRQNPDKPLVFTGQFEPNGNPVLAPAPLEQQTETVTIDADGNERITRKRPVGSAPAPAPGPAGGAAPIERTTSSGVKVQVSMPDQAGRMTGQMPNEAYANPLTSEQSLEAARAEYLATGSDAALRKHFQQFPSQQAQNLTAPTATKRVMTQQQALAALQTPQQPAAATAPMQRPAVPTIMSAWAEPIGRNVMSNVQGAAQQLATLPEYARRNPLAVIPR